MYGTSLDKGVELDALAKMPASERASVINRAVAGERVSARQPKIAAGAAPFRSLAPAPLCRRGARAHARIVVLVLGKRQIVCGL